MNMRIFGPDDAFFFWLSDAKNSDTAPLTQMQKQNKSSF